MIINLTKSKNILINLEKDKARLLESSNELHKVNIPFERFDAVNHTKGIVGCGMSHLKVLSENKKDGLFNGLLILEDDIQLTGFNSNIIFDVPNNTDAVYLGISKYGFVPKINVCILDSIFFSDIDGGYKRIYNMCSTHSIIYLSERYVDAVISTIDFCLKNDIAFDLGIASIHKNFNVITPKTPIFYQKEQPDATRFILI
jgi:hypothetical protein